MPATLSPPTSRMRCLNSSAIFEDLAYEPHDGQLLVHRSRALRRVLACGTRFGKSTCAAMEACVGLLEPRHAALAWVVAPSYELTKRIWMRVVHAFQDKLPHRVLEVIPREHRLLVRNQNQALDMRRRGLAVEFRHLRNRLPAGGMKFFRGGVAICIGSG